MPTAIIDSLDGTFSISAAQEAFMCDRDPRVRMRTHDGLRLRVHVRGRDRDDPQAREEFLLQVWIAPEAPELILRQDRYGANFNPK